MIIAPRVIIAFLIAPIALGLVAVLASSFLASPSEGGWALMFSALVGYPTAFVVGVPLYVLCRRLGWDGLVAYALLSIVCAALLIGGFILFPMAAGQQDLSTLLSEARLGQMLALLVISIFSVMLFWLIARPDQRPVRR